MGLILVSDGVGLWDGPAGERAGALGNLWRAGALCPGGHMTWG